MAISLQELRKAEKRQHQQEQKQRQAASFNRSPRQNESPAPKGVLKFAQYLYGN